MHVAREGMVAAGTSLAAEVGVRGLALPVCAGCHRLSSNQRGGWSPRYGASMEHSVGQYLALYFDDVASAVEFCHELVSHVCPRVGAESAGRAVVWFHVPRRSTKSTRDGCYLFLSPGALRAAQLARLEVPVSGVVPRSALPPSCVLVFGEDSLEQAPAARAPIADRVAPVPTVTLPARYQDRQAAYT